MSIWLKSESKFESELRIDLLLRPEGKIRKFKLKLMEKLSLPSGSMDFVLSVLLRIVRENYDLLKGNALAW